MKLIFLSWSILLASCWLGLPIHLAAIAASAQTFCERKIANRRTSEFDHFELVQSYLCGSNLKPGNERDLFADTGIFHIIVVSGSHLVLLMAAVSLIFRKESFFSLLVLSAYAVFTGLQPPIARAFSQKLIRHLEQRLAWHWNQGHVVVISGVWVLCLFPNWVHSMAMQLSFAASLAVALASTIAGNRKLFSGTLTYLCLLPFLAGWAQISPLSILTNAILAPILAVWLWIVCLVWLVWPPLGETLLNPVFSGLRELTFLMPRTDSAHGTEEWIRWAWILTLCFFVWIIPVARRRPK